MTKVDRRIQKTQEALRNAVIELMSDKNFDEITIQDISDKANVSRGTIYLHYMDKYDLLDKLIESHINQLREVCEVTADLEYIEATQIWTAYFEEHYSFFSLMLTSKGAPYFHKRFLNYLIEEVTKEVDVSQGKNEGFRKDVLVHFIAAAQVGLVEWWFANGRPIHHKVLAEQLGRLLERNL
ncbi:TetR/AcrR family transcriptional regulator [Brevibacillus brevis]|uniref:TetR/AcrR family transcriptional regulator n=1 Tax=Brevibacillus brevis TaxID=1393 RepID=A0ABY9SWS2_BREBE|nr:TetR/AcrR family transcriptional regulator [Brevibacillus brevis]WNC12278.1 TetR/AcrR family transcriptional regulator [Brevibacillus brevis]